jgi:16S rRNA (adenine1518-N6/adenine1519-N6)-dimethyltransferase
MPRRKKALGQHHLRSGARCLPLLTFLAPAGQRVLEVGPGGGVLTAELLACGARVLGCEIDVEWVFALRQRLRHPALRLLAGDALRLEFGRLPAPTLVTGNLPYAIGTALIERLLPHYDRVPRAAFLVQREVAERLVARPGEPSFGALTVLTAVRAEVKILGRLGPASFRPRPKVESAFVGFGLRRPPLPAGEMESFAAMVRAGFSQRRKTLRNSLAAAWGRQRADELVERLGLDPRIRAERLDIGDWLELHRMASRADDPE